MNEQNIILIVAICVSFLLLFIIWWSKRKTTRIKRLVRNLSIKYVKNITLPDGLDGEVLIDYLLLAPDGLIVITVNRYEGLIYGAEHLEEWTQVVKKGSYRFKNPLHKLKLITIVINNILVDVPIECKTLFTSGVFPKDKPDAVMLLQDQVGKLQDKSVTDELLQAWQKLQDVALSSDSAK